ncbi:MAG: hypothetical protein M1834_009483 [Cirrosporium novae-zelandiae]|nr:MAG: hypothetical protein M1834_009483 [Cirrosporium novae-zelandiae]
MRNLLPQILFLLLIAGAGRAYPSADGRLFDIDGKKQYFAGTNAWWLGHLYYDDDVDTAMSQIAATKLKVVRVWGFGNVNEPTSSEVYYQVLNSTGGYINYGSNGISRLDAVISAAEQYGVKLVLPMLNNWDDLGGINTYVNAFGGNATTFYTDTASQATYKKYVKFLVNRYKNSSAIFAWELCNEPRCNGCPSSTIYDWASEVSKFVKSIDSNHLVALGDEGWMCSGGDGSYAYSCSEGVDFVKNLEIETLDYGTFHLYPNSWGYNYSWGSSWIKEHNAAGATAGKAVVLEEYGTPVNHTTLIKPWQQTILEDTQVAYDSFWQFGTVLPSSTCSSDDNTLWYNENDYLVLATQHAKDMLAKEI